MLSEKTRQLLASAGWFPGRLVDTEEFEAYLAGEGYTVGKAARSFLQEYGGLHVTYPHHTRPEIEERFHLDPIRAANSICRERVETYEPRVGESLAVIGEAYREYYVLMMAPSGGVFAAYDDFLIWLGDNGTQALITLCENGDTREIPMMMP